MNKYNLLLFFIISSLNYVLAQDSIPTTELKEIVIESDRAWVENGVYNFIPTKKDKQLSNSPGTLINMMNIPMLRGDRNGITTISNDPVSIFINGNPATEIDLSTFLPKNVKKIEYLQDPSDPMYRGKKNVVNFIVTEYSVGGVTRVDLMQTIPDRGFYLLGSKLTYKRMSYGLRFLGRYDKWHSTAETEDTYKEIWYDGIKYDLLRRTYAEHSKGKNYNFDISANAVYNKKDSFRAVHTLALGFDKEPGGTTTGENSWSANLFNSDYSASYNSSRGLRPSISGDYDLNLSQKIMLNGYWQYVHADNTGYSWNRMGENGKIENESKEKIDNVNIRVGLSYDLNSKCQMELFAEPSLKWYSTQYSGSNTTQQNQFREDMNVTFSFWYKLNSKISFKISPGFIQSHYKVADDVRHEIRPDMSFSGQWNPNRKFSMNLSLRAFRFGASASESNPVMIQLSELEWATGNQDLKNMVSWSGSLNLYYRFFNWLSVSGDMYYSREENTLYTLYAAAPKEMGGIIRNTVNAPSGDHFSAGMGVSINLFSRRLSIFLSPSLTYRHCRGEYAGDHVTGRLNGNIGYRLRNVKLELSYDPGQRVYGVAGNVYYRKSDSFNFDISYGISDWYFSCGISDIFHLKRKDIHRSLSNVFDSYSVSKHRGRACYLNITYTIGYGKKIDPNINVEGASSVESSVVR